MKIFLIAFLWISSLTFTMPCFAQVTPGTPPFGSFSGGSDVIDLANLNVHLEVPVIYKAGRGMSFAYNLSYDSSIWQPVSSSGTQAWQPATNSNWGWTTSIPRGGVVGHTTTTSSTTCIEGKLQGRETTYSYTNWTYYDGSGTAHPFPGSTYYGTGCYTIGPSTLTSTASDGSGYALKATGSLVDSLTASDGAIINLQTGGLTLQDRNGNQITEDSSGNYYDTLSSTAPALSVVGSGTPSSPVTFTYKAPSGSLAEFKMIYAAYTVQTNYGCSGIAEYGPSSINLVSEIDLPDISANPSDKFTFVYEQTPGYPNSTTGRLKSVTLPTGGAIVYTYTGGSNGVECSDGSTSGLERATPDGTTVYTRSVSSGSPSITTVTDPSSQHNQIVLYFQGLYLTQRQDYSGSSQGGTLLQSMWVCYNGETSNCNYTAVSLPITQRQVWIQLGGTTGPECTHIYKYDTYGNPLEIDDYDYGSAVLLRKEIIAYAPLGNNINSFRQTDTIENGSGQVVSETKNNYDETTPISSSGTPQHVSVTGARGDLTSVEYYTVGSSYLKKVMTYWDTGNMNTITDVNNALATAIYGSGSCGNSFPTSVSLPLGISRSYTWNCNGGVQTSLTDENNQTTTIAFTDSYFWRSSSTTGPTQAAATNDFLSTTQKESTLSFNSSQSSVDSVLTLDELGRTHVQQTREAPGSSNFDSVETDYDSVGRVARVTLSYVGAIGATNSGAPSVTTTYDTFGRPLSVVDSGGGTTSYIYQGNDNLVTQGPAPSGEKTKQRQLEYDSLGRLTSVCELTQTVGSGTCSQTTSQTGFWTKYSVDPMGHLTAVTQNAQNTNQQTRSYKYDLLGRMTSATNAESGITTYVYDSDSACGSFPGDLVKKIDAVGNVTCYSYDLLHRRLSITYPSGSYAPNTPQKHFVYDAASVDSQNMSNGKNRLAEAYTCFSPCSSKLTDLGFSYTPRGGVSDVYELTPNSHGYYHVNALYWDNGLVKQLSGLAGLPTISIGPDGKGRVKSVSASVGQNPVSNVSYTPANQIAEIDFGSGDSDKYTYYSTTNRLMQSQFIVNGQTLSATTNWNQNGTVLQFNVTDPFNSTNTQNCSYLYDDLARISSVNCGSVWSQTFTYDAFGNINKSGTQSFQATYSYLTNHMTEIGSSTPSYDVDGNVTNDFLHTYQWDAAGRPIVIDAGDQDGVDLTYDALGRMVEQDRMGTYQQIVYSPLGAKLALFEGQALQKAIVHLPGGAVAVYNSAGLLYYGHADRLHSIPLASTAAQPTSPFFDIAYAPYGETYASAGSPDPSFTGQRQDTVSLLYDFSTREYGIQGRWPAPDPAGLQSATLEDPQTLNRYSYVRNSPLTITDPSGSCNWLLNFLGIEDCDGPDGDNDGDDMLSGNPLGDIQLPIGWQGCTTGPINLSALPDVSTAQVCVSILGPQIAADSSDGQGLIVDLAGSSGTLAVASLPSVLASQAGRAFQQTFNQTFNVDENVTFKIESPLGNSVPDLISEDGNVMVGEIKSGQYIYMTNQLEIQQAYAVSNDLPYYVIVSPDSEVASTVVLATEETGGAVLQFDATTGALVQLTLVDGEVVVADAALSEATVEAFVDLLLLLAL